MRFESHQRFRDTVGSWTQVWSGHAHALDDDPNRLAERVVVMDATSQATDPLKKYERSWWVFGILLGLWALAVAVLVVWGVRARAGMQPFTDNAAPTTCAGASAPRTGQTLATLTAEGNANTAVMFRRDLQPRTRALEYGVDDPSSLLAGTRCLEVEVGQFLRDSGDAELNPSKITATGALHGQTLRVDIKFDRTADSLGPGGSYAGVISIVDPRVQRVDIPMTVTMSYPTWQFPFALLVALLLPAIIYLWLLKGSFQGAANSRVNATTAAGYLISRNGLLAVATGAVAAFGSFTALYLTSPTWDADPIRYIALMTGTFSAFVAAATGVAAAGVDRSGT
nr:hypothetical protein [uncultured Actinoplanes sp.]